MVFSATVSLGRGRCGESRAKILRSVLNNRSTKRWTGPWCFQEMQSDWSRGARGITLRTDSGYVLEKAMAPHSSTLAWKIPWTEEPGRLQSMGLRRVGHD